jgi:hypothetical protein
MQTLPTSFDVLSRCPFTVKSCCLPLQFRLFAPLLPPVLSPTTAPVALPAVPLPRVQAPKLILSPPVAPPRVPKPVILAPLRQSPRARLDRLHFDPSTHRRHLVQTVQLAVHYDPTIAGKMYNPVTGKAENIDSLRSSWPRCH